MTSNVNQSLMDKTNVITLRDIGAKKRDSVANSNLKYKTSDENDDYNFENNIKLGLIFLRIVFVRVLLLAICGKMFISFFCVYQSYKYLAFLIPIFLIPADLIYILLKRKGKELKWYIDIYI